MRIFFLQASSADGLASGFLILGFLGVLFFVLRAVMIWYWKIDLILKELQEQNAHLKTLINLNAPPTNDLV